MLDKGILKETISILMQSASYFYLTVQERLFIIKHLMKENDNGSIANSQ